MGKSVKAMFKFLFPALLFFLSIACNLISSLSQEVEEVKSTVASVATDALEQQPLATVHAVATQLAESHLAETAKAIATQASQSGALETIQAITTEQAPGLVETMQAFLTQEAPALEETAQALLTQIPPISPLPAEDIPIIEGEKENLVTTQSTISYLVAVPFADVLSFYKQEMPQNGWTIQESISQVQENSALLNYTKGNRIASISISFNPANQKTIVVITLENP
ncbi:MAG: hypothetical protein Kow0088_07650 [Anaerolineales bacterium]